MDSDTQRDTHPQSMGSEHPSSGPRFQSLTDQLRQQAQSRFSNEKDRAVQGLTSLADAARQTGRQLREKDQLGIASYIERAADQATQFSERLANKDLGEIVNDVERFAHRQPALFLGVSFGIGLLGARFLKSSRSPAAGAARPNVRTPASGVVRWQFAGGRPDWLRNATGGSARDGIGAADPVAPLAVDGRGSLHRGGLQNDHPADRGRRCRGCGGG